MISFCHRLPKIELHAHLNGSLSDSTLKSLQNLKNASNTNPKTVGAVSNFKIKKGHTRTLAECFAVFGIAQALTDTPEAVKLATFLTLAEFDNDGVVYLELRSTPRSNDNMTKIQYIESMVEAIKDPSKSLSMKTCILVSIDRRNSAEQAEETVLAAIEMNKKYSDVVVGLDLSGDPTVGNFSDFSEILAKGKEAGLKIAVHTAEVLAEKETLEILIWKPDRLGHATYIFTSPMLWNTLLESKIPVEVCLTSNVKSGTVQSYSEHHFQNLFMSKHPISLATDDKGVFATTLSEEFNICANTFNLNEDQLWTLSFQAIDYIFSDDFTKKTLKNILQTFKSTMKNVTA